jgi:protein-arginine kinase activator protein McsA
VESETSTPPKALTPMDMLDRDLAKAIVDERYEDAARLRDEIKRLKTTHTDN